MNRRAAVRRPDAAPRRALPPRQLALVESALVVVAWLVFAYGVGKGGPLVAYDAFRDMAYAHRILVGGLGHDPSLAGMPAWYPPGDPLFFALVSRISFVPVVTLYATSVYWLGWTAPLAVFWLARSSWGRLTAWLALPCVLFGSYWWLVHAAMPMPSVQAVALALATMIAWNGAAHSVSPSAWKRLATTSLLAALTTWVHPLCGAFALGSIALHGALAPWLAPREPGARQLAVRALAVAAGGCALSLPVFFLALGVKSVNDAPRHWFAPELHDAAFAAHAYTPLVWMAGAIGLLLAFRDWRDHGWLVAWFALGMLGMLAGYAGHDLHWPVPWTIPHEFQWHEQLALTLAAAFGIAVLATRLARRGHRAAAVSARSAWALGLAALAVGPGAFHIEDAGRFVTRLDAPWQSFMRVADAVMNATPGNAVIAAPPEVGYFLSGFTGRQVVALPAGHTNPLIDPAVRAAAVDSLLGTNDHERFVALVHRYQVSALLVPASALPGDSTAARLAARPGLVSIVLPEPGWLAYGVRLWGGAR